jgi:TPR repeat protein
MKGQKYFDLAMVIHNGMYSRRHTKEEQVKLHNEYFNLTTKAAYLGNVESQFDHGNIQDDIGYLGIPNPVYNPKKAFYWYSKACVNGHSEACNNLADFYERGVGCGKNLDKALQLYKLAAERGSPSGKRNYRKMLKDLSPGGKYNK